MKFSYKGHGDKHSFSYLYLRYVLVQSTREFFVYHFDNLHYKKIKIIKELYFAFLKNS